MPSSSHHSKIKSGTLLLIAGLTVAAFFQNCSGQKLSLATGVYNQIDMSSQSLQAIGQSCESLPTKDVYIIAGQSNAEGLGQVAHINGWDPVREVFTYRGFKFQYWNKGFHKSWQNGAVTFNGPNFGPEISLAAKLQVSGKSDFYIYKSSSGGSALRNLGGVNEWRSRGARGIYDDTIRDFQDAQFQICQSGFRPVVKALFWMQGESDSNVIDIASQYEANLSRLVKELREDILAPNAPIILGKIRSGSDSLWTYAEIVRAADDAVARNFPLIATIETNDLSYYRVGCDTTAYCVAHYDARGILDLGNRFYDSYISVSTNVKTPTAAPEPTPDVILAEGFYRIGNIDGIYYVNGKGGGCVFTSWNNFIRWGGYQDGSNVTSVQSLPSKLILYGACL